VVENPGVAAGAVETLARVENPEEAAAGAVETLARVEKLVGEGAAGAGVENPKEAVGVKSPEGDPLIAA